MSSENLDAVRAHAKDLTKEDPRSPKEKLGGFELGARALDKCRASLVGINGEYRFNCPMDQRFFQSTGIDSDEFRNYVATGADDQQVAAWVQEHATADSSA